MNIHIVFGKNVNFKYHMVKMKFPSENFMTKEPNMNGSVVINSKLEVNQNHRISEDTCQKYVKRRAK